MDIISKVYNPETPVELLVDLHEFGGVHSDEIGKPGMTDKQIQELVPRVLLPSDIDLSEGWYKSPAKETHEEFRVRVRRVAQTLRDLAGTNEEEYTICIVSHALFMNSFFTTLLCSEFLVESKLRR